MIQLLSIDEITAPEWSIKQENDALFHKLKRYIAEQGQTQNIIVCKPLLGPYEVVKGRSILRAMKEIGCQFISACNLGDLTAEQAKYHYLKMSLLRQNVDSLEIAYLMRDLLQISTKEDLIKTLPFTVKEMDVFENLFSFDWTQYDDTINKNQGLLF